MSFPTVLTVIVVAAVYGCVLGVGLSYCSWRNAQRRVEPEPEPEPAITV
jgi:hypothetical protein